jgi:hypothetical protein
MATVFALLPKCQHYPDALGYGKQFERIVGAWRPAAHQKDDVEEKTL